MTFRIPIALAADRAIEVGLHTTLYSLMRSSSSRVSLFLFLDGFDSHAVERLRRTLKPFSDRFFLEVIQFKQSVFSKYRSLHGNRMMFAKLLLTQIVPCDRIIYLDSDLVVNKDILTLFETRLEPHAIAASGVGTIRSSNENKFLNSIGLDLSAAYFNSGVLLIDLDNWRSHCITEQCFAFADRYPSMAFDQTILNYVFYRNNFVQLDDSFNLALYPSSPRVEDLQQNTIFHFVGSPKPWDLFGEYLHNNYNVFNDVLENTEFRGYKSYHSLSAKRLNRTLKLARSYYKAITNKRAT
jgi:lipopolysaccharide biosynthesis glycosyltransferase